jgi:hypothetical protein
MRINFLLSYFVQVLNTTGRDQDQVGVRGVWESPKISSDLAVGESILYVDGGMYNDDITTRLPCAR